MEIACGTGFGKCPAVRTVMIGSSPKPVVKPKIAASTVTPKTALWRSVERIPTTNDSKTITPANSNINAVGWNGKSEREMMPFCNRNANRPMTSPTTNPLLCDTATSTLHQGS